jgi:hypothetical protein
LAKRPGVVCVGWGKRHTKGRWYREPCLSVHVKEKIEPDELGRRKFRKTLHGHRVDVIEVGEPVAHQLDVASLLAAPGIGEFSTVTALTVDGNDGFALTSGHAVAGTNEVTLRDGATTIRGVVEDQAVGTGAVDWGIVRFANAAAEIDVEHRAVARSCPLPATVDVAQGTAVQHYSARRSGLVGGEVQSVVLTSIEIGGILYTDLLAIMPTDGVSFSVPRDSGSLVVQESDGLAVGAIVGGPKENDPKAASKVSYVYELSRLPKSVRDVFFHMEDE